MISAVTLPWLGSLLYTGSSHPSFTTIDSTTPPCCRRGLRLSIGYGQFCAILGCIFFKTTAGEGGTWRALCHFKKSSITGNDRYSGDRYSGIDRFSGTKTSDDDELYLLQTTILVETAVIVEQKPLTVFSTITVVACIFERNVQNCRKIVPSDERFFLSRNLAVFNHKMLS